MSNELNEALAKQRALDAAKKAAEKVEKKPVVLAKTPDPKQKFVKLDKSKPEITAPKADQAVKAKISLEKPKPSKLTERLKKRKWWQWLLLLLLLIFLIIILINSIPVIILVIVVLVIAYYILKPILSYWWLLLLVLILGLIAYNTGLIKPATRQMTPQEITDRETQPTPEPTLIRVARLNDPNSCGKYRQPVTGDEVLIVKDGDRYVAFLHAVGVGGVIRYYTLRPELPNQSAKDAAPYVGAYPPDQIDTLSTYPFEVVDKDCRDIKDVATSGVDIIRN